MPVPPFPADTELANASVPSVPPVPIFRRLPSVPEKASVLLAVKVFPFDTVSVPVVDEIRSPLMLVAVATPRTGVVSVGDVPKTASPVPVSSLSTLAS